MAKRENPALEAPIPGMALTHEVGARPWQTPAQYSNVKEAAMFYVNRMQDKNFTEMLVNVLETGVPVTTLANTIQLSSVMQGVHNIDVGILTMPVIMEMIMLVGDSADIKYNTGLGDDESIDLEIKDTEIANILSKFEGSLGDIAESIGEEEQEQDDTLNFEEIVDDESQKGLMSRR